MSVLDPNIQVALLLKTNQFQKSTRHKMTLDLMIEVFSEVLWKEKTPTCLSQAIDAILSISDTELMDAFKVLQQKYYV